MNKSKNQAKQVIVPSREVKILTCPYCWTDQRTDRDFCYRCGAGFIYLDEVIDFAIENGQICFPSVSFSH